ncbi:hypothetical protein [Nocardia miyunensis]|uniref:hypothetical protein n=1 Tax=Nocardia miyunensis TaxID=282684 RepID=UPI000AB2C91E|nr:hypothetical protein [Nocardia miyunensis]
MNHNAGRSRRLARMALTAAATLGTILSLNTAVAGADQPDADRYLGVWNYDQPDTSTGTNIAVIQMPGAQFKVPQIGTMTFSRDDGGGVVGRSDQGCTWHFAVGATGLDLTSKTQYCFNKVIGSGYSIDTWHVEIRGDKETETIHATSYNNGGSYPFILEKGTRTKAVTGSVGNTNKLFAGTWIFDPSDPATRLNILQPSGVAKTGSITFSAGDDGVLQARTSDGCQWRLAAAGNTAELAPATQKCGSQTMSFWAIASDGHHEFVVMSGIDPQGNPYLLTVGTLTRS